MLIIPYHIPYFNLPFHPWTQLILSTILYPFSPFVSPALSLFPRNPSYDPYVVVYLLFSI